MDQVYFIHSISQNSILIMKIVKIVFAGNLISIIFFKLVLKMAQRNQFNIGQTNKTSVKVHHGPGGQSNWSLGWGEANNNAQQKQGMKYRNQSNIVLGETSKKQEENQRKQLEELKRKKQQELNNKLPTYDPKNGGKSNLFFGEQKTDYRKKDEVFTSVKVKAPPGGKSNIQFG